MQAIMFKEATNIYKAPKGHDPEKDGEIFDLPVMDDGHALTSVWKPTPEELDILNKGGGISLSIIGRQQPPIYIGAIPLDISAVQEPAGNSG